MTRFIGLLLFFLALPLMAAIGAVIVLADLGPPLYAQRRVGRFGKTFLLYKFRTMVVNAEDLKKRYRALNQSHGPTFKIHHDPRFTRVGKFLSHTGLDELPQFWNVMVGEMAFIGPRPLPVDEARQLRPWMKERERVLPGILSPAIIAGTYHRDFTGWMKSDVVYAREKSFFTDALLVIRAVPFFVGLIMRELRAARQS